MSILSKLFKKTETLNTAELKKQLNELETQIDRVKVKANSLKDFDVLVETIKLSPNDKLVVRTKYPLTVGRQDSMIHYLESKGIKNCIIIDNEINLSVLKAK